MRNDILGDAMVCIPESKPQEDICELKDTFCVESREVSIDQQHLIAIKKIIDNCTPDEADYICESLATRYPLIMMDALADRINTLTGVLEDFKKQIRSV